MNKRKMRVAAFILAFLSVYLYACMVFAPKSYYDYGGSRYYAGQGFRAEDPDTIDILAVGNSDLYSGFNPLLLYQNFGYTSYNSGVAKQTLLGASEIFFRATKNHKLKLLLVEGDFLFGSDSVNSGVKTLLEYRFLGAPFEFHFRWKQLRLKDFYTVPGRHSGFDPMKGYQYDNTQAEYRDRDYMGSADAAPALLSGKKQRLLDEMLDTCKEQGIAVLFTVFPSATSWSYAKHNALMKYCKEKDVPFVDFNVDPSLAGLEYATDFRDNGNHLNAQGAEKVTTYLGNYLRTYYNLEDRRDDAGYEKWEESLSYYERFLKQES